MGPSLTKSWVVSHVWDLKRSVALYGAFCNVSEINVDLPVISMIDVSLKSTNITAILCIDSLL